MLENNSAHGKQCQIVSVCSWILVLGDRYASIPRNTIFGDATSTIPKAIHVRIVDDHFNRFLHFGIAKQSVRFGKLLHSPSSHFPMVDWSHFRLHSVEIASKKTYSDSKGTIK